MSDERPGHAFVFDRGEKTVTVYCDGVAWHRMPVPEPGQVITRPCDGCRAPITLTGAEA
jgi:hypothetical protein